MYIGGLPGSTGHAAGIAAARAGNPGAAARIGVGVKHPAPPLEERVVDRALLAIESRVQPCVGLSLGGDTAMGSQSGIASKTAHILRRANSVRSTTKLVMVGGGLQVWSAGSHGFHVSLCHQSEPIKPPSTAVTKVTWRMWMPTVIKAAELVAIDRWRQDFEQVIQPRISSARAITGRWGTRN